MGDAAVDEDRGDQPKELPGADHEVAVHRAIGQERPGADALHGAGPGRSQHFGHEHGHYDGSERQRHPGQRLWPRRLRAGGRHRRLWGRSWGGPSRHSGRSRNDGGSSGFVVEGVATTQDGQHRGELRGWNEDASGGPTQGHQQRWRTPLRELPDGRSPDEGEGGTVGPGERRHAPRERGPLRLAVSPRDDHTAELAPDAAPETDIADPPDQDEQRKEQDVEGEHPPCCGSVLGRGCGVDFGPVAGDASEMGFEDDAGRGAEEARGAESRAGGQGSRWQFGTARDISHGTTGYGKAVGRDHRAVCRGEEQNDQDLQGDLRHRHIDNGRKGATQQPGPCDHAVSIFTAARGGCAAIARL